MESSNERRQPDRRTDRLAVYISILALVVAGVFGGIALKNTSRIAEDERADAKLSRGAAYRICSRENATRAVLHQSAPEIGGVRLLKEREKLIPILDCSPNLTGGSARQIQTDQQRKFVRVFHETGTLPLILCRRVVTVHESQHKRQC